MSCLNLVFSVLYITENYEPKRVLFVFENKKQFSKTRTLRVYLFLFLKIVHENTYNTIFVFSKNYSCSLNLVFSVFFETKKLRTKYVLPVFVVLLVFENGNNFQK